MPTDDLLSITRKFINSAVSGAGLRRCLRRHGVSYLRDLIPVHVTQIQEAQAEAPVALVDGQAYQPVSHDSIFRVELGAIAIAGLANAKCLAGQSYDG